MKSHMRTSPNEKIISYGITADAELYQAAMALGIKYFAVPEFSAGEQLGYLAGYAGFSPCGTSEKADKSCIIFSGIDKKRLDVVLDELKKRNISVPLKAVITATNQGWTLKKLVAELENEHKQISD